MNAKELVDQILPALRGFVARNVEPLLVRVKALEERQPDNKGEKGDPGERGADGAPGADGQPGKDGAPGVNGKDGVNGNDGIDGEVGDPGMRGEKGDPGDKGNPGEPGLPGEKGADGEAGRNGDPGERGERGERGEKGDVGPAGKDGADGLAGKDGAPGAVGPVGPQGERGADGIHGKDADPLVVAALVAKAVGEIPKPQDGRDGRDGERGADAFAIDVLPAIDPAKRYQRGAWAKHDGGLWCSRKATDGMDGWECIVDGIKSVEAVQDEQDPRKFALGWKMSSGAVGGLEFRVPVPIYRGIWKEGDVYERGDTTTRDGCTWILRADQQNAAPGIEDSGWQMSVKRGRDGANGLKGEKGERGAEGRAGKDLTQLGPNGAKW